MARVSQLLICCFIFSSSLLSFAHAAGYLPEFKIRGPNLGGWLNTEGWIKPSLFDGIINVDFTDGATLQFKSLKYGTYLSATGGGGSTIVASAATAGVDETFKVWRVNETFFQLRVKNNKFVGRQHGGLNIIAKAEYPLLLETFELVRKPGDKTLIKIKASDGFYLQAKSEVLVTADYKGEGWEYDNPSVFNYTVTSVMQGEYQITNGYGPEKAPGVMEDHWRTFITEADFKFLKDNGFNAMRIPVGWWTTRDPNPPKPYVGGSLKYLDKAYQWAEKYNLKIVLCLHAAPGSQNGYQHGGSRDGSLLWGKIPNTIPRTLEALEFLVARYSKSPSFYAMELLNEPMAPYVTLKTLVPYYTAGYKVVRKYSQTAYVVMSVRLDDPFLPKAYSSPGELIPLGKRLRGSVLDVHYYSLFLPFFATMTPEDNVNFIKVNRTMELTELSAANGSPLIYVGEWSCDTDVTASSNKTQIEAFADVQIKTYGTTDFGWTYWTLKNVQNVWSLEWLVKNGYFKL